jgi:hypothetical protein
VRDWLGSASRDEVKQVKSVQDLHGGYSRTMVPSLDPSRLSRYQRRYGSPNAEERGIGACSLRHGSCTWRFFNNLHVGSLEGQWLCLLSPCGEVDDSTHFNSQHDSRYSRSCVDLLFLLSNLV